MPKLVSRAENKRPRKPRLKTQGRFCQQLSENQTYYECGDLFQLVYSDIDLCMSRAKSWTYPIGIWWGPPARRRRPRVIGVDVFRDEIGAVGVLIFKCSAEAVRRDIDLLREHLDWVGDTYTPDKTVDTVLVIRSAEEWLLHRDQILQIAKEIDARIGDGA